MIPTVCSGLQIMKQMAIYRSGKEKDILMIRRPVMSILTTAFVFSGMQMNKEEKEKKL